MSEHKLSRKDFMNIVWGTAGFLAATELSLVGLSFLSPRTAAGEFGGVFKLGHFDQFPEGSVTPVEAGRFYLVRLPEGGFMAVYRRCTHLGCAVPYDPSVGMFVCPCHGSEFTMDGDVLNEPAPRALDLFTLSINEAGEIEVDTSSPVERDQTSPNHILNT